MVVAITMRLLNSAHLHDASESHLGTAFGAAMCLLPPLLFLSLTPLHLRLACSRCSKCGSEAARLAMPPGRCRAALRRCRECSPRPGRARFALRDRSVGPAARRTAAAPGLAGVRGRTCPNDRSVPAELEGVIRNVERSPRELTDERDCMLELTQDVGLEVLLVHTANDHKGYGNAAVVRTGITLSGIQI